MFGNYLAYSKQVLKKGIIKIVMSCHITWLLELLQAHVNDLSILYCLHVNLWIRQYRLLRVHV